MFMIRKMTVDEPTEYVVCWKPSIVRLTLVLSPAMNPLPERVAVAKPFAVSRPAAKDVTLVVGTIYLNLQDVASLHLASKDAARKTITSTVEISFAVRPVALI